MGLAFWTHQISIIFLLTSSAFLLFHFRFRIVRYLTLIFFFLVGLLPLLVSELYWNFPLMRVFFAGEQSWEVSGSKTGNFVKLLTEIITGGKPWTAVLGFAVLGPRPRRPRRPVGEGGTDPVQRGLPRLAGAFTAVYLLSSSSSTPVIRYLLHPLHAHPRPLGERVLLDQARGRPRPRDGRLPRSLLPRRERTHGPGPLRFHPRSRPGPRRGDGGHGKTGEKYWRGHYWISYLLNSVTHERLVVASTTVERYPAYPLLLETETDTSNYVFLRDTPEQVKAAADFVGLLKTTGKAFKTAEAGQWQLVHGIRGRSSRRTSSSRPTPRSRPLTSKAPSPGGTASSCASGPALRSPRPPAGSTPRSPASATAPSRSRRARDSRSSFPIRPSAG